MRLFFIKISSFLLAITVLLSTFSFTVEKHFCGDFLVDVSFFGDADSCVGEVKNDSKGETVIKKKKCCKDELQQIQGQDDIEKTVTEHISFEHQKLIIAFYASYKLLYLHLEKQFIPHQYYSPPNIIPDIQVLHEVFII